MELPMQWLNYVVKNNCENILLRFLVSCIYVSAVG